MNRFTEKRNVGIDLFRCVCVYGICAYHAFFMGGFANGFESRLWTWCVPGFAFISGFYGVRLRVSKVIRLWVTAAICFLLPIFLGGNFRELLFMNWYLLAYTFLMLLSPILNAGMERLSRCDFRFVCVGMTVLATWSWLSDFALTRNYVPRANGMGALSICSVLVAYICGFLYRRHSDVFDRVKSWWLFFLFPSLLVFGHYTSPITLLCVMILFRIFSRLSLGGRLSKLITWIAASGFAVYVLHANWQVLPFMHSFSRFLIVDQSWPRYIGLLTSGAVVWMVCVALYFVARIVLMPISEIYNRGLSWVDARLDSLML